MSASDVLISYASHDYPPFDVYCCRLYRPNDSCDRVGRCFCDERRRMTRLFREVSRPRSWLSNIRLPSVGTKVFTNGVTPRTSDYFLHLISIRPLVSTWLRFSRVANRPRVLSMTFRGDTGLICSPSSRPYLQIPGRLPVVFVCRKSTFPLAS